MSSISLKRTALYLAIQPLFMLSAMAVDTADNFSAAASEDEMPEATLPAINVKVDFLGSAYGPVAGIAPSMVSTTTGVAESILKSTQTVNVVGQEQIRATGATSIVEALDYTPGVIKSVAADKTTEDFIIRGFRNKGSYRDGQKYQANIFNGRQEVYGLERIEVLKGPGSVLSGTLPPGGTINAISKKPFFDEQYEVNAEIGRFSRKEISADFNQPLTEDVAVRVVGVYRDSDTFIDHVDDDRQYIAPSLTWWLTDSTRLTLQADYQKDKTKYVPGMPAQGTVYSTENGKIAVNTYPGVANFDRYDNERATYGYEIEHHFTPDLTVKQYLRKMETKLKFPYTNVARLTEVNDTETRRKVLDRQDATDQITGGLTAVYRWSLQDDVHNKESSSFIPPYMTVDNVTLFGLDYAKQKHESERFDGTANPINLYDRHYDLDKVGTQFSPNIFSSGKTDATQKGIYLQNQATVNGKWVGVLGMRHDEADLDQKATFTDNGQNGDYSKTTFKAGMAYLMDNGVAPYTSFNESFEVNLGVNADGNDFDPTNGRQFEAGVRYQPTDSDMLITASAYHIKQNNLVVSGATPGTREQLGEVRSQGVELEAQVALNDNTNIVAAYSYTDARMTKTGPKTPELDGQRQPNVPYNTVALWGDYRFADFGMPDLKMGAGVRYTDSTLDRTGDVESPSHTLVNVMTSYAVDDHWLLSLTAHNLFDKEYATCTYDCFYGEPRNIIGKVTYKW